jgi:ectoine hydroxylase-related dioxygenase (phytanoyl-CoA dioxygenase family)
MFVKETHVERLHKEGYFVLESVIPPRTIEALRAECDRLLAETNARMTQEGKETDGLTWKGRRYFLEGHYRRSRVMMEFVHSPLMVDIATWVLGKNVYLFVEQFVVKAPRTGAKFGWHQDSGYIPYAHKPYLTCWCALDDMTEENGTVYVLPYGPEGMPDVLPHPRDEETGEDVGYAGPEPGIPLIVPAGSVAVFTSRLLHRSGPNLTGRPRRCYLPQYSAEPIMSQDGLRLRNIADPIVLDGKPIGPDQAGT